jgi:hypothetical protein
MSVLDSLFGEGPTPEEDKPFRAAIKRATWSDLKKKLERLATTRRACEELANGGAPYDVVATAVEAVCQAEIRVVEAFGAAEGGTVGRRVFLEAIERHVREHDGPSSP